MQRETAMQRIEIENFGPIKNVAFDIKDYTVFIGPQASGKSTIARAVYFFRSLHKDFENFLNPLLSPLKITNSSHISSHNLIQTFAKKFRFYLVPFGTAPFSIRFFFDKASNSNISVCFDGDGRIDIDASSDIDLFFKESSESLSKMLASDRNLHDRQSPESIQFFLWYSRKIAELFCPKGYNAFIPAGRSIFSAFRELINIPTTDPLIFEFAHWIVQIRASFDRHEHEGIIRSVSNRRVADLYDKIIAKFKEVVHGNYLRENGRDFIVVNDTKVPLVEASSGQQESLWVFLSILDCIAHETSSRLIIEEPEAHLFPESQRNLMSVLTLFSNKNDNELLLTTHSPYILTPLNNLLLAHKIGQDKREAVEKVVDPDLWINPERFECYYVDGGTIRSVMDRQTGMMDLDDLDAVSGTLNEQYDLLAELED